MSYISVDVDICSNCLSHKWCTRHDQHTYLMLAHELKESISSKMDNVLVHINTVGQAGGEYLGSFQVKCQGVTLFSKLALRYFPHIPLLTDRVIAFITDFKQGKDLSKYKEPNSPIKMNSMFKKDSSPQRAKKYNQSSYGTKSPQNTSKLSEPPKEKKEEKKEERKEEKAQTKENKSEAKEVKVEPKEAAKPQPQPEQKKEEPPSPPKQKKEEKKQVEDKGESKQAESKNIEAREQTKKQGEEKCEEKEEPRIVVQNTAQPSPQPESKESKVQKEKQKEENKAYEGEFQKEDKEKGESGEVKQEHKQGAQKAESPAKEEPAPAQNN